MHTTVSSSEYVYPAVLPWPDIYRDLKNVGYNDYRVAELIGRTYSTVQYWFLAGIEPKESSARAILLLHERYCGSDLTKIRLSQAVAIE